MKYYLIAGEASGDLHGANLARSLREADPDAHLRGWGGDRMAGAGVHITKHYRELAYMGFWEVLKNLPAIRRNFGTVKNEIQAFQPDALVLIDYPGFNLRLANWAKKQGLRIFYYVSPQLWAWHSSRVRIVRDAVERMYVILPFEREFYARHGVEVGYYGHPLAGIIEDYGCPGDFLQKNKLHPERPIVALLPGSRRQEVERMLPVMLSVVPYFPNVQFAVAGAPSLPYAFYEGFLRQYPAVRFIADDTYALLSKARAALVASGTATLETAIFEVPQVVCYTAGHISYRIARMLVNPGLEHIAMVNLIAGYRLVPELLQRDLNTSSLRNELERLLTPDTATAMRKGYATVRQQLHPPTASGGVGVDMVARLRRRDQ